ncbi:MAG: hypothetical protein KAU62_16350 [Candidatus Heimdallarchaeota archaeon]|nr:hypothetical protein [Candidatus Heimdallarchaeota archaeon]MCK4612727.1 hypothetical protein [Candidatus Heimdallarchaeota archaeon]
MKQRWKIIITSCTVMSLCALAVSLHFYFQSPPQNNNNNHINNNNGFYDALLNHIYPNPLWNGSASDIILESDDIIHFCTTNCSKYGDVIVNDNLIYGTLNFTNDTFYGLPWAESSIIGDFYQVRIALDSEKCPIIYTYAYSGFDYQFGEILKIINNSWEVHPLFIYLPLNISALARSALLNWFFSETGDITIAYIYQPPYIDDGTIPYVYTPVIYNASSKQATFMHEIFPEITNHDVRAPGDFKIVNSTIALLWERRINDVQSYTYLAICWPVEGWQLYIFGDGYPPRFPIAIIPRDEGFDVFHYESGRVNNISRIFVTTFFNSTHSETKEITTFPGQWFFIEESIFELDEDNYLFIYNRFPTLLDSHTDLYLGKYNGTVFQEVRLTNTPNFSEYYAHGEKGEKYFHYVWNRYYGNEPWQVFYYRISFSELDQMFDSGSFSHSPDFLYCYAKDHSDTLFSFLANLRIILVKREYNSIIV